MSEIQNGLDRDALDDREDLYCEERKLRCDLLRSRIAATDQQRELDLSLAKRRALRDDCTLVFAALFLSFETLRPGGSGGAPELIAALVAIVGFALRIGGGGPLKGFVTTSDRAAQASHRK